MSTDLIVLFERHAPETTPARLLERLLANPTELRPVVERYKSQWRVQDWAYARSESTSESVLEGPGGFSVRFEAHIVQVYDLIPFSRFASNLEARDQLRRVWRWFAQQLGSTRAIYIQELMPHLGVDLTEVEATLRTNIGPPASDFDDLSRAEHFGPGAWYIDDFRRRA